ncbi:pyrroline-5-carboxylate reductase [Bacillus sp. Marseille-Q1617]|uniref:pyrroline-5-carboxylate reductase n=1 Tax=Bacillus sp. Marseille-Q1617 TaxID=2736887 RepID=UPI00158F18E8|nr:pyrroline-5-carboxylate reductase [Bacillus sp. Marseille-Q1617]
MKTLFIGAGSMAHALLSGAINAKVLEKEEVYITNRTNHQRLQEVIEHFGVNGVSGCLPSNEEFDVVILAMKPKDFHEAGPAIRRFLSSGTLIISVLAGISIKHIRETLAFNGAISRAMPNTSAALRKSATAVTYNEFLSERQKEWTLTFFGSVGLSVEVPEEQMDLITAVSGSGPAYIYYVAELLEKAAVDFGLQKELARALITQTIAGASKMLEDSGQEAGTLRKNVTSPGGTTEAGISTLDEYGVSEAFLKCVDSARNRSQEMGKELIVNRVE